MRNTVVTSDPAGKPKGFDGATVQMSRKDVNGLYEDGKHRRYSLLFAVNGGAFAVAQLLKGTPEKEGVVLGGMTLWMLAGAIAFLSAVMCDDIYRFGVKYRTWDGEVFQGPGQVVLALLCGFLVAAWLIVGFVPPRP